MAWGSASRTLQDGRIVTIKFWNCQAAGGNLGCHVHVCAYLGIVYIAGIKVESPAKLYGKPDPTLMVGDTVPCSPFDAGLYTAQHTQRVLEAIASQELGKDITAELIRDIVYSKIVEQRLTIGGGAVLFSDRVNRRSKISTTPANLFGKVAFTTAAFAKWLSNHPEYGFLFSSPIFHNPNHSTARDFGLCQVWTWIFKSREKHFYVAEGESVGIGPDTNLFPKANIQKVYNEGVGANMSLTDIKATYDDAEAS